MNILQEPITTAQSAYRAGCEWRTGQIPVDVVLDFLWKVPASHSVSDIAVLHNVDARQLSAAFSLLTKVTLRDFIMEWRLLQALDLLDDPDLTIEQVGRKTGFHAQSKFETAFIEHFGTSPYVYRNGDVARSGGFHINATPAHRREMLAKADELHHRNDASSESETK